GTITDAGPRYRGRSAIELARAGTSFEEVCALLWEVPPARVERRPPGSRLGVPIASLRALLRPGADPFDGMLVASAALAATEPRGEPTELSRVRAPSLVRRLIGACALPRGTDAVTASLEADGAARAVLVALGGRTTPKSVAAIEEALVLSADHELNAS